MKTRLLRYSSVITLLFVAGCQKKEAAQATTPVTSTPSSSSIGNYDTFGLQNATGGNYAEVSGTLNLGAKLLNGTTLQQNTLSATAGKTNRWQEWQFCLQSNGYYTIMNLNSGKYLDVPDSTTTSGTTLDQYSANGSSAQYWAVTAVGTHFKITNKGNGLALTNHGASTSAGTPITQETYTGNYDQLWTLNPLAPDSYREDAVVPKPLTVARQFRLPGAQTAGRFFG
jgi:hypothetical protein